MSQLERKIAQKIREIADPTFGKLGIVMSGKVVSADDSEMTAKVQLTMDDADIPTDGIVLNVKLECTTGVFGIPANDADCQVLAVDGQYELIKASQYKEFYIKTDTLTQFNGGSNDGLVKVGALVTKLNAIENDINNLKTVFSTGWTVVASDGGAALKTAAATWYGSPLSTTAQSDLENTKVKH